MPHDTSKRGEQLNKLWNSQFHAAWAEAVRERQTLGFGRQTIRPPVALFFAHGEEQKTPAQRAFQRPFGSSLPPNMPPPGNPGNPGDGGGDDGSRPGDRPIKSSSSTFYDTGNETSWPAPSQGQTGTSLTDSWNTTIGVSSTGLGTSSTGLTTSHPGDYTTWTTGPGGSITWTLVGFITTGDTPTTETVTHSTDTPGVDTSSTVNTTTITTTSGVASFTTWTVTDESRVTFGVTFPSSSTASSDDDDPADPMNPFVPGLGPNPVNPIDDDVIDEAVRRSKVLQVQSLSATAEAAIDTDLIIVTGSGTVTVNLTTANDKLGRLIRIKYMGSGGTVTVDPSGSETIDGATTWSTSTQYDCLTIVSDGTNWVKLSEI